MEKIIFNNDIVKKLAQSKTMIAIEEGYSKDIILEKVLEGLELNCIKVKMVSVVDDGFETSIYYKSLRDSLNNKDYDRDTVFIFNSMQTLAMLKENPEADIKFIVFTDKVFNFKHMDNIFLFNGGRDRGRVKKGLEPCNGEVLKSNFENRVRIIDIS